MIRCNATAAPADVNADFGRKQLLQCIGHAAQQSRLCWLAFRLICCRSAEDILVGQERMSGSVQGRDVQLTRRRAQVLTTPVLATPAPSKPCSKHYCKIWNKNTRARPGLYYCGSDNVVRFVHHLRNKYSHIQYATRLLPLDC